MKLCFFFLFLLSPVREHFNNRNYWKVLTVRSEAKTKDDTLLILLAERRYQRTEMSKELIVSSKSYPLEVLVTLTANLYKDKKFSDTVIKNLCIVIDSLPELRDYFSVQLIQKYLENGDTINSYEIFKSVKSSRQLKSALDLFASFLSNKQVYSLLDSLLNYDHIPQEHRLFLMALKHLKDGDSLKAGKEAEKLAKLNPTFPPLQKFLNLLNDTLKAFVYYKNGNYKLADNLFRRLNTNKFLLAQLLSAYRVRDYAYVVKLLESKRGLISEKDLESILLQIGYAYWKQGETFKALEYLTYSANNGNEESARLILDILLKEKEEIVSNFLSNVVATSSELNYTLGLFYLYKGDTARAVTNLKKALSSKNAKIKIRARFFLKSIENNFDLDKERGESIFEYFAILCDGLKISKDSLYEPEKSLDSLSLKKFKFLLLWGDEEEALRQLGDDRATLLEAIKVADYFGYDHVKIKLALKYFGLLGRDEIPLPLFRYMFPTNYYKMIKSLTDFYGVKPEIVLALIREESRYNPEAVSSAGAIGLMQLMPQTARNLFPGIKDDSLKIADINLTLGIKYLRALSDSFPNLIDLLCAYNAGPQRIKEWKVTYTTKDLNLFIELIPFRETREYVHRILRSIIIYNYILGSEKHD